MDGQNSLDISADLLELSRCAIMVVSAGVKSILDIGRTLEYLVSIRVQWRFFKYKHLPVIYKIDRGINQINVIFDLFKLWIKVIKNSTFNTYLHKNIRIFKSLKIFFAILGWLLLKNSRLNGFFRLNAILLEVAWIPPISLYYYFVQTFYGCKRTDLYCMCWISIL